MSDSALSGEPVNQRSGTLRLWPAVAIVALFWIVRGAASLWAETGTQFMLGFVVAPMLATLAVALWWLLASRVAWRDRLLVAGVVVAAAVATAVASANTFPIMGLILYALPLTITVWVGWLLLSTPLNWPLRRGVLLALLVVSWALFTLLRFDGTTGAFAPEISWRWTPTAESRFLAELASTPRSVATPAEPVELELQPGDWPEFRGPQRDSRLTGVRIATDWNAAPPRRLWQQPIGPGWSSFAVVGNRAYTQEQRDDRELVVCYDTETGREFWTHADSTRFTEAIAGPGPRATPTFHAGRLYTLGANGNLNCLHPASGELIWTTNIATDSGAVVPMWGFSSSPLICHGVVTVFAGGPDDKSVVGYDAETGAPAWSGGSGKLSYCSTQRATLGGVEQLLITTDAGLLALHPQTGSLLWQHAWPTTEVARIVQPAVIGDSDVLIGTGMGVGTRRISARPVDNAWQVDTRWTSRSIKPYYNDLVVHGDHLYGFDGEIFMCVGLDDGKVRWRRRGYGTGQVLLLVDQALLLVLSETGEVALVAAAPDEHRELGRFPAIEGKTWNHPVVAHGKLLVRNGEQMACYALEMVP